MKVTGYAIKTAIAGWEHRKGEIQVKETAIPNVPGEVPIEGRDWVFEALEELEEIESNVVRLQEMQQAVNGLVMVNDVQTLAQVIRQVGVNSRMLSQVERIQRACTQAEGHVVADKNYAEPSAAYPQGQKPRYAEPLLTRDDCNKLVRKYKERELTLKNLIGYGNGVAVEVLVEDPTLLNPL